MDSRSFAFYKKQTRFCDIIFSVLPINRSSRHRKSNAQKGSVNRPRRRRRKNRDRIESAEEELANLLTTFHLGCRIEKRYFFLACGHLKRHRRIGRYFGCSIVLTRQEGDPLPVLTQPTLTEALAIRDKCGF